MSNYIDDSKPGVYVVRDGSGVEIFWSRAKSEAVFVLSWCERQEKYGDASWQTV
jgi:hypothetical protein